MKLNGMLYHFPRAKFADNDIRTQVGHVLSEAKEARAEERYEEMRLAA